MRILVGIKQILDPEIPPRHFRIDPDRRTPIRGTAKLVMDSYAEYALELAIQLREKIAGTTVVVVCLGEPSADELLRKALAFSVDDAVRLWDETWSDLDAHAVAHVLGRLAARLGGVDLVLVGRQAGDVERGMVGPMLAEELGAACVVAASRLEVVPSGRIRARREVGDGHDVVEVCLPAVITVSSDAANVLRIPTVKNVLKVLRRPIRVLGPAELDVDAAKLQPRVAMIDLHVPEAHRACEFIGGDGGDEQAEALTRRLRELRLV